MKSRALFALFALLLGGGRGVNAGPVIESMGNGTITWISTQAAEVCSIQYASVLTGRWRGAWSPNWITMNSSTGSAQVPMFYRVISHGTNDGSVIGIYHCDGNALDASGQGNQGVVHGAILTNDQDGAPLSAYYFHDNDLITVALPAVAKAYSVALWFRALDFAATPKLFAREEALWPSYHHLRIQPDGALIFQASGAEARAPAPVLTGVWYHAAATYDQTNALLYVNGALVGRTNWSAQLEPANIGFSLGGLYLVESDPHGGGYIAWYTNCLHGMLDEVGIWRRALESNEVRQIYDYGL